MIKKIILSLSVAILALAFTGGSRLNAEPVTVLSANGDVKVMIDDDSDWEQAAVGETLFEGSRIKTGKGGEAVLKWKSGHTVKVYPLTVTTLDKLSGSGKTAESQLNVNSGKVFAKAKKLEEVGGKFSVRTPTAIAAVRGTEFMVEVSEEDQSTMIALLSGSLDIMTDLIDMILEENMQLEMTAFMDAEPQALDLDPGLKEEMEMESRAMEEISGGGDQGGGSSSSGSDTGKSDSGDSTDRMLDIVQDTIDDAIRNSETVIIEPPVVVDDGPVPPMPPY